MGKGRPKGYSPYKTMVKVSRAWLDDLRGSSDPSKPLTKGESRSIEEILCTSPPTEEVQPKIEFNLTNFDDE